MSRQKNAQSADDAKPKSWFARVKESLKVIGATPRAIALVWKAHPGWTIVLVFLSILFGLVPIAQIWITKLLVDTLILSNTHAAIPFLAQLPFGMHVLLSVKVLAIFSLLSIMGLVELVSATAGPAFRYVSNEMSDLLTRDINTLILRKANGFVDISMFENPIFYDLLQKAQRDAGHRPMNLIRETAQTGRHVISLVAMSVVLATFQPLLVLAVFLVALPHVIVSFKNQRESWKLNTWESPEVRTMWCYSTMLTSEHTAKEIRLFGLGDFFLGRYHSKFGEFRKRHHDLSVKHWRRDSILSIIATLGQVAAYGYAAICTILGVISLGSFTLYSSTMSSIQQSMWAIIHGLTSIYENNLFINHLYEFLDLPEPMQLAPAAIARAVPVPLKEGIEFRNVAFSYEGSESKVLSDISFKLLPGQSVALVGENGAGKTTLVKLLSRLYDPSEGAIIVDGADLRDYDLKDWRSRASVIFQDFTHYPMTAQENIGVGQVAHVNDYAMVKMASEKGGAAPVIDKLNKGYDTTLGGWFGNAEKEEMAELSGGEWQKVALSRAFMRSKLVDGNDLTGKKHWEEVLDSKFREAQLLILDEPTASLDAQAEHDVYQRFKELTAGKITLLISHRFSTVRMADVILVLEKGAIAEQGSHQELMARGGTYARLYTLQAERYT